MRPDINLYHILLRIFRLACCKITRGLGKESQGSGGYAPYQIQIHCNTDTRQNYHEYEAVQEEPSCLPDDGIHIYIYTQHPEGLAGVLIDDRLICRAEPSVLFGM